MQETLPLKDFIVSTLTSICDAVDQVRREKSYVAFQYASTPEHAKATLIEFDLAITISAAKASEGSVNGDMGIKVLGMGAKVNGEVLGKEENSSTSVNRIRFNVPVDFRLNEKKYEDIQKNLSKPTAVKSTKIRNRI